MSASITTDNIGESQSRWKTSGFRISSTTRWHTKLIPNFSVQNLKADIKEHSLLHDFTWILPLLSAVYVVWIAVFDNNRFNLWTWQIVEKDKTTLNMHVIRHLSGIEIDCLVGK